VVEVGEKDLRLENIVKRASRGLEGLLEIFQDEAGLKLDIRSIERKVRMLARLCRHAGFEIACELTGCENPRACNHRLGIVGQRTGRARFYNLDLHCPFSFSDWRAETQPCWCLAGRANRGEATPHGLPACNDFVAQHAIWQRSSGRFRSAVPRT